jgi:AraC-like DNA-binding protein
VLAELAGGEPKGGDLAQPFSRLVAPLASEVSARLLALATDAAAGATEPLELQERLLGVAAAVLGSAGAVAPAPSRPRRSGTWSDHRERAEAVKVVLARRLGERLDLASLGREVHASPFHLARLFRAVVGTSIHRYHLQLRLRHAAARVADGERDLAGLAHELGFADHSHLTRLFRHELGMTPSAFRRALGRRRASAPPTSQRVGGASSSR